MTTTEINTLRYPAGPFIKPTTINSEDIKKWIHTIHIFPRYLSREVESLTKHQLVWRYRPKGWTIQQLVHHCADSHMNSVIRFKLALTEDEPAIKAYEESEWADLPDTVDAPIGWSLDLLTVLHQRWTFLLGNLSKKDLKKKYYHPANKSYFSLDEAIALYAWHCEHHLEHIRQAKSLKFEE